MATTPVVLAVDDEPGILRLLRMELGSFDFRVLTAANGSEALRICEVQRPDIVILDLDLPQMSGLEIMRCLRERSNIPVIILSGRDHDEDRVRGLDSGADDYLIKPFNTRELAARISAVLRRQLSGDKSIVNCGDLVVDLGKRTVIRNGEPVEVTRTEWLVLRELATNAGHVVLNTELLTNVWGPEFVNDTQYLRVWISRLRSKDRGGHGESGFY